MLNGSHYARFVQEFPLGENLQVERLFMLSRLEQMRRAQLAGMKLGRIRQDAVNVRVCC